MGIANPTLSSDKTVATFPDKGNVSTGRYEFFGLPKGIYVASVYVRKSNVENAALFFRAAVNDTKAFNTGTESEKITLTDNWQRVSARLTSEKTDLYLLIGNTFSDSSIDPDCSGAVDVMGVQVESGTTASSYIPTNGSPVTRERDDARFTDPSVFNNFERGAFVIDFKLLSVGSNPYPYILKRQSGNDELITANTVNNSVAVNYRGGFNTPTVNLFSGVKASISWSQTTASLVANESEAVKTQFQGTWGAESLLIGSAQRPSSFFLKSLDFHPELLTESEAQQLATLNARTVIGDCPSGGYYDYSDLSTLFVESDESGIPIAERAPARVGDPIGAILDVSGHENHMTASTDDRRGVLESDGVRYWIRHVHDKTLYTVRSALFERTTTFIGGMHHANNQFILASTPSNSSYLGVAVLNDSDKRLNSGVFKNSQLYVDNERKTDPTRNDLFQSINGKDVIVRGLAFGTNITTDFSPFSFNSSNGRLNGKSYGFAWASRLSEDNALIVEKDMRRNMPAIPA